MQDQDTTRSEGTDLVQGNGNNDRELRELIRLGERTSSQVQALHDAMLGELGHVRQLREHIERLYAKARALEERDDELESMIASNTAPAKSFLEQLRGGWFAVGVLLVAALELVHLYFSFRRGQ